VAAAIAANAMPMLRMPASSRAGRAVVSRGSELATQIA
jgi:hypothetical protein